ncbi:hypothetical protein B0H11DRAFT_1920951 [Mycena galericulata]|nr:hypothetical protein B0H11DRAFT_1920951 [Mycena galericulata]
MHNQGWKALSIRYTQSGDVVPHDGAGVRVGDVIEGSRRDGCLIVRSVVHCASGDERKEAAELVATGLSVAGVDRAHVEHVRNTGLVETHQLHGGSGKEKREEVQYDKACQCARVVYSSQNLTLARIGIRELFPTRSAASRSRSCCWREAGDASPHLLALFPAGMYPAHTPSPGPRMHVTRTAPHAATAAIRYAHGRDTTMCTFLPMRVTKPGTYGVDPLYAVTRACITTLGCERHGWPAARAGAYTIAGVAREMCEERKSARKLKNPASDSASDASRCESGIKDLFGYANKSSRAKPALPRETAVHHGPSPNLPPHVVSLGANKITKTEKSRQGIQPRTALTRFVKWPEYAYICLQHQKVILHQRPKEYPLIVPRMAFRHPDSQFTHHVETGWGTRAGNGDATAATAAAVEADSAPLQEKTAASSYGRSNNNPYEQSQPQPYAYQDMKIGFLSEPLAMPRNPQSPFVVCAGLAGSGYVRDWDDPILLKFLSVRGLRRFSCGSARSVLHRSRSPKSLGLHDQMAESPGCLYAGELRLIRGQRCGYALAEWDATSAAPEVCLVGGTFGLVSATSPTQHAAPRTALRMGVYVHLALLLEQHFLTDSGRLACLPPPSPLLRNADAQTSPLRGTGELRALFGHLRGLGDRGVCTAEAIWQWLTRLHSSACAFARARGGQARVEHRVVRHLEQHDQRQIIPQAHAGDLEAAHVHRARRGHLHVRARWAQSEAGAAPSPLQRVVDINRFAYPRLAERCTNLLRPAGGARHGGQGGEGHGKASNKLEQSATSSQQMKDNEARRVYAGTSRSAS